MPRSSCLARCGEIAALGGVLEGLPRPFRGIKEAFPVRKAPNPLSAVTFTAGASSRVTAEDCLDRQRWLACRHLALQNCAAVKERSRPARPRYVFRPARSEGVNSLPQWRQDTLTAAPPRQRRLRATLAISLGGRLHHGRARLAAHP
jgi:hypothetical protein